jgi:hypothetical protein
MSSAAIAFLVLVAVVIVAARIIERLRPGVRDEPRSENSAVGPGYSVPSSGPSSSDHVSSHAPANHGGFDGFTGFDGSSHGGSDGGGGGHGGSAT